MICKEAKDGDDAHANLARGHHGGVDGWVVTVFRENHSDIVKNMKKSTMDVKKKDEPAIKCWRLFKRKFSYCI